MNDTITAIEKENLSAEERKSCFRYNYRHNSRMV